MKILETGPTIRRQYSSDNDDISALTIRPVANTIDSNTELNFKIDTGADVTVIPEELVHRYRLGQLQATSKKLFGADQKGLQVIGAIREIISLGETCVTEDIYLVSGLKESLLGRPAIISVCSPASVLQSK